MFFIEFTNRPKFFDAEYVERNVSHIENVTTKLNNVNTTQPRRRYNTQSLKTPMMVTPPLFKSLLFCSPIKNDGSRHKIFIVLRYFDVNITFYILIEI